MMVEAPSALDGHAPLVRHVTERVAARLVEALELDEASLRARRVEEACHERGFPLALRGGGVDSRAVFENFSVESSVHHRP